MRRSILALTLGLLGATHASAEPLPWSYYVRFVASGGADTILLGTEGLSTGPDLPPTTQYITYPTGMGGFARIHFQTDLGTHSLFSFDHGDWTVSNVPPPSATTSVNAFELYWGFTARNAESQTGEEHGFLSASGIFTSGTGNFLVGLDVTRDVILDGQRALVRFHAANGESGSRIEMTVTPNNEPIPTPEPATVFLATIGLAGVSLWRRRNQRNPRLAHASEAHV